MSQLLILFFALIPGLAFGQGVVKEILSPTQVLVELINPKGFVKDQKVMIISAELKQLVALGYVRDSKIEEHPNSIKIQLEEIISNKLVMIDDTVEVVDYKTLRERDIPGFNSLTLAKGKNIPSEYQELAYFGVFTSEGHTLSKSETLVSPFQIQYGVTDSFGVRVVNTLWLDGYANAGIKGRVLTNKYAKITLNGLGAYKVQSQDWIAQLGGVITVPSNSKFQSHFMFTATLDPQYEDAKATKDLRLFTDSDIRSITEYITDDWNRILYGPVYNVELQTFGGTVSYMWIWSSFHLSLGLATKDFTNLTFGPEGYYYVFDFFWRF